LKIGFNQTEIAEEIGDHKSTISRELKRNTGKRGYRYKQAQKMEEERRKKPQNQISPVEWAIVEAFLKIDWSPEQISFWILAIFGIRISHEWI